MTLNAGRVDDYADGACRLFQLGMRTIAVLRVGDEFFAFDDMCPHRAGPLSEGERNGCVVSCPWHGARFDARTGKRLAGPSSRDLVRFAVKVEDSEVIVSDRRLP